MLGKQDQIRFLNRELASVRKFLTGVKSAKPGKKEIHDVRINIKKIIALLELNKIHGYQAGNLSLLGMQSLFKTTGAVRSSQIILNSLEKSGIVDKKINEYHSKIVKTNTRKLAEQAPAHLKMLYAFRNEMTLRKLHTLQNHQVLLYHGLKSDYLKQIFKKTLNPDNLHEGRKQIKLILYVQELMTTSIKNQLPFNMKNLEQLQDMIGKWHDTVLYLGFMQEFILEKKHMHLKELINEEKDQFALISSFMADKNNLIFIS